MRSGEITFRFTVDDAPLLDYIAWREKVTGERMSLEEAVWDVLMAWGPAPLDVGIELGRYSVKLEQWEED
jgi:hypothetical protein